MQRAEQSRAGIYQRSVAGRASLNSSFTCNYDYKLLWKTKDVPAVTAESVASCLTPDLQCCDVTVRGQGSGSEITLTQPVIGLYNMKQHDVTAVVIWR